MPSATTTDPAFSALPILDLSLADSPATRPKLLRQLHDALFNIGFLYVVNHGVSPDVISALTTRLPALFDLPANVRASLSKRNSPHFLGYSGFAEETTLGKQDLREQFDCATELPVVWREEGGKSGNGASEWAHRDFSKLYWRLRGPNQWPPEELAPGFRKAFTDYHDAVAELSYRFVHLVEEAFEIPVGTFDAFFRSSPQDGAGSQGYLPPQHRIKLLKYPPSKTGSDAQGVGAHKDSSGWLTFLYQVGEEEGLEVVNANDEWIPAPPIPDSFVVNFGNAFEAATEGGVRATTHRVKVGDSPSSPAQHMAADWPQLKAPKPTSQVRYSIPFFQGLPLDLTASEIRGYIPEKVRSLRRQHDQKTNTTSNGAVSSFLDPRWDSLGESQLRKWIRSHEDVGRKWYGNDVADYYLQ